jgi:predicted metalloprotease with PDZ domain
MRTTSVITALTFLPVLASAQAHRPSRTAAAAPVAVTSATYAVTIDPRADMYTIRAQFTFPQGRDTVLLSLPAWSPGDYEINNYARWVHNVRVEADGRPVFWDKLDTDTWRIAAGGARSVTLEFKSNPDSLMLQFSGINRDFAWFNGTNFFVYPEGSDYTFPADVTIDMPQGWRIATALDAVGGNRYHAPSYHDLVDSPVYAGALFLDSVVVDGRPIRFAAYPDSAVTPVVWDTLSSVIRRLATAQNRIVGGPPYQRYTILFMAPALDLNFGGGLEHANSQFDVIPMQAFANRETGVLGAFTPSLISHESFHLFNVKRLRPAEMWPYEYSHMQPTPLLWWSEGVTDYYGDVTATRSGVWSVDRFLQSVQGNIAAVEDAAEIVAPEDASIDTWISPTFVDESQYYYPKGSLLGLMLDIRIRTATNNQHSLDDVFRTLWTNNYQRGRGFTTADLLGAIRQWYPDVDAFYARYINGRDSLPYAEILPLAGIVVSPAVTRVPRIGISQNGSPKNGGVEIGGVQPGSLAEEAGLAAGDLLASVGGIPTDTPDDFGIAFRARYANGDGQEVELVWRRGDQEMRGRGHVHVLEVRTMRVARDSTATGLPRQILDSILGQER